MPTIDANGLRIGYDVVGAGPPLLVLHGATSSGLRDLRGQSPGLTSAFRCYFPDARGHGRTRWDVRDGFEAGWLVDDAMALVDALGLHTVHVLGFSMGAMTALGMAVRQPGRLRTLVLAGISAEREPRATVVRNLLDPLRIERSDPTWAADLARRLDPTQGAHAWRRLLPAIAADVANQPLLTPRQLRTIDPPTLVIVGDGDPFVPVDHAWRLSRSVLDGRLLVLPGARHEALAERPTIATAALATFYRSTEAVASRRASDDPDEPDQPDDPDQPDIHPETHT